MDSTTTPALEAVLSKLQLAQPVDGGWMAQCPSCRTRDVRSLFVGQGEGDGVRLWCQHGCSYPCVVGMLSLPWEEVERTEADGSPDTVASSDWVNAAQVATPLQTSYAYASTLAWMLGGDDVLEVPNLGGPHRVGIMASISSLPAPIPITQAEADAVEDAAELRFFAERARLKAIDRGVLMSDVVCEEVTFLWPGRIPLGKLTTFDGDPGLGKSMVTVDLAARVSTGRPMPDGSVGVKGGVILIGAEDGLGDTVAPRLAAAGADMSKILHLGMIKAGNRGDFLFTIDDVCLGILRDAIAAMDAKLVIIDPLMAHLGEKTNSFKDQDVRRALSPLAQLADETGAAILMVRHLSKSHGGNALYAGGSSIGIIGQARAGFLIAVDPDDEAWRIFAPTKSNLAPKAPALRFRLEDVPGHNQPRVKWGGVSAHTANALVSPTTEDTSAVGEARTFLLEQLADGPVAATVIQSEATREKHAQKTLRRAQRGLGIKPYRVGGQMGGPWMWQLPEDGQAA
jgi:hypothetical protein